MKLSEAIENDVRNNPDIPSMTLARIIYAKNPDYAPINNWNHGFAINLVGENGNYEFRNYKIVKGRVV